MFNRLVLGSLTALGVFAVSPARAHEGDHWFTGGGFSGQVFKSDGSTYQVIDGVAHIYFSGQDRNGDGFLSTSELTYFDWDFYDKGSVFRFESRVPVPGVFALGGFNYRLGNFVFGAVPGEFVAATGSDARYTFIESATGAVASFTLPNGNFPSTVVLTATSSQLLVPIPEPTTLPLLLCGLGLLGCYCSRAKASEGRPGPLPELVGAVSRSS